MYGRKMCNMMPQTEPLACDNDTRVIIINTAMRTKRELKKNMETWPDFEKFAPILI